MPLAALMAQSDRPNIGPLSVPRLGQYYIERFWNVTLNNPDSQEYHVWLEGTITETVKGQVFWAKTNEFPLPNGVKVIHYNDIQAVGISQKTHAPGYEQFARGAAGLPPGTYTYSVKLMPDYDDASSPEFEVRPTGPPRLRSPRDGDTVPRGVLVFLWAAPPGQASGDVVYAMRIAEVLPGTTPEKALNSLRPWFEQRDILGTSFTYPSSAPALREGEHYAWQVTAVATDGGTVRSEVWAFTLQGPDGPGLRPDWSLLSPTANVVDNGPTLSAGVTVKNAGTTRVPVARLRMRLKSGGDFHDVNVPALEPGESLPLDGVLALPDARDGMTDTVLFEVAGDGDVKLGNNRAAAGFQIPRRPLEKPDWRLSSPIAEVTDDGRALVVGVTVENVGNATAPPAAVRVWRKTDARADVIEVPGLAPHASISRNHRFALREAPDGLTDTVFFEVHEERDADAGNNRAAACFRVPPRPQTEMPDLAVVGVSSRPTDDRTALILLVEVANNGIAASGPTTLEVTSVPSIWDLTRVALASVRQGKTIRDSVEFDIPAEHRGETVRFSVRAIPVAGEVNAENNLKEYSVALPASIPGDTERLPDFALANPRGTTAEGGKRVVFSVDVHNLGSVPSGPVRLELTSPGSDVSGSTDVQPLAPRGFRSSVLSVEVSEHMRGKTVEFSARVDPENSVRESNETNNAISCQVVIPPRTLPREKDVATSRDRLLVAFIATGASAAAATLVWLLTRSAAFRRHRLRRSARRAKEGPRAEIKPDKASTERLAEAGGAAGAVRRAADDVYLTVTSPAEVGPKADFLVNVWAHLDAQREEVLKRAHQAEPDTRLQAPGAGPFAIARNTELDLFLSVEDCTVEPKQATVRWTGAIANAGFTVRVNDGASEGSKRGYASVRCSGLEIARVPFLLKVTSAASAGAVAEATGKTHRKAFASYARADAHDVLTCVQGMEKALPGISIFLDVLRFRSGEYWQTKLQQEILASDILYLFWSKAAASSEWVEKEWRFGLEKKGLDFIDPVPLVSPRVAPPPPELSAKHFDDWELAFKCYQEAAGQYASDADGGTQA